MHSNGRVIKAEMSDSKGESQRKKVKAGKVNGVGQEIGNALGSGHG